MPAPCTHRKFESHDAVMRAIIGQGKVGVFKPERCNQCGKYRMAITSAEAAKRDAARRESGRNDYGY